MINFTITRIVTIAPTKTKREIEVLRACVRVYAGAHVPQRDIFEDFYFNNYYVHRESLYF